MQSDRARRGRAHDARTVAWWWTLYRNDEALRRDHREWYVVSRDGRSACDDPPADPDWRRFRWDAVTRLVNELAAGVAALPVAVSDSRA